MTRRRIVRIGLILLPLVELLSIIGMGKLVGVWWTIALLFAGGLVGVGLVAAGGKRAIGGLRQTLGQGTMPDRRIANSVLTVAGGLLLLVPGFVTDILGLIFVLPPTRRVARTVLGLFAMRKASRVVLDVKAAAAASGGAGGAGLGGAGLGGGARVVPADVISSHDVQD